MIDSVLRVVSPHRCYGCGFRGAVWCPRCEYDVVEEGFTNCLLCARPLGSASSLCKTCNKRGDIDAAWCVDWREGDLKRLIDDYKFQAVKEASEPLSRLLDARLPLLDADVVTEVPTSNHHVRTLGYDHARLLTKRLAGRRELPYRRLLSRLDQQTQHFSSLSSRLERAESLFEARQAVAGKVLLVDDIVTTGTTLKAAAKTLKAAGAESVYAVVLVRQPRNG